MSEPARVPSDHLQELADAVAANPRVQRRIAEDAEREHAKGDDLSYVSGDDLRRLLEQ